MAPALVGVMCLLIASSAAAQSGDAIPESPARILQRAFERRYDCNTRQVFALQIRLHERDVQHQRIEVVSQSANGRLKALARFTEPDDLRDTALLVLEQEGRPDDYFLFLPALERVRRVSGAQRSDSFMGTDLSYEDLERRRVEDFEALEVRPGEVAGEAVHVVGARPRQAASYARVEFAVARGDAALLEIRYYAAGSSEPYKRIRFPRAFLHEEAGVSLPRRILVENHARRTTTEVTVDELEVNPEIDPRLFTTDALLREAAIEVK